MLLKPDEGKIIIIGPAEMRVKTPAESSDLFIAEHVFPPGFAGPGEHRHPAMTHAFYVVEGQVRFKVDKEEAIVGPGTFVYVPANVIHSFSSGGDSPARCLEINAPGGFDRYYTELANTFAPGMAVDQEILKGLQRQHGIVPM